MLCFINSTLCFALLTPSVRYSDRGPSAGSIIPMPTPIHPLGIIYLDCGHESHDCGPAAGCAHEHINNAH